MPYMGNNPIFGTYPIQLLSGNGVLTSFTLTYSPASTSTLLVTISGVKQQAGAYSVTDTTIDFGAGNAPPSGTDNIEILYLGQRVDVGAVGDGTIATAKIADNAVTTPKVADSTFLANRNRIINGNFDVWERGTSFAGVTATGYQADRWEVQPAAGCTMTITRQAFTAGQTDVPYEPTYFLRTDITTAGSANAEISQKIEDVRTFAGQTVVASFYAKSTTGTQTLNCRFHQDFGSGGSTRVTTGIAAKVLTSSWQKFSFTLTLGSVSGKTIGSSSWLGFNFYWANSDTANDVDLAQVQVEAGSTVTPFEYKSIGQEFAACQRYYQNSYSTVAPYTIPNREDVVTVTSWQDGNSPFPVFPYVMRAVPTVTLRRNGATTTGKVRSAGTERAGVAGSIATKLVSYITVTSGTANSDTIFSYELDAEI